MGNKEPVLISPPGICSEKPSPNCEDARGARVKQGRQPRRVISGTSAFRPLRARATPCTSWQRPLRRDAMCVTSQFRGIQRRGKPGTSQKRRLRRGVISETGVGGALPRVCKHGTKEFRLLRRIVKPESRQNRRSRGSVMRRADSSGRYDIHLSRLPCKSNASPE